MCVCGGVDGNSVLSTELYCEPKATLNNKVKLFKVCRCPRNNQSKPMCLAISVFNPFSHECFFHLKCPHLFCDYICPMYFFCPNNHFYWGGGERYGLGL